MSRFVYPTLPARDIVAVLAQFEIAHISERELLHPDPDFIYNLYSHILMHVNVSQEDNGQMDFGALELLENPDLHVHSVQVMNLYNKVREFLAILKCPQPFKSSDLIMPVADRTVFFLGSLLNFLTYRATKLELMGPVMNEYSDLEQQRVAAEARIDQLNAEIAEFEEARERELPLVQEVKSKVNEHRQTISGLNNHQMSLKASIKQLKEKTKEMDEKISNAEFALVQSVQENANLRSKIVQSPDKLQRALEEKKVAVVEAKNAERAAIQSFQDKSATLEAYAKGSKKMSKHFAHMQALQEQVTSAKSVEKDVKVLKSKLSDEGMLDKSLQAKIVDLQAKADQLKESKRQIERERSLRMDHETSEFNKVKLEAESKRHTLEQRQRQVESVIAEGDAITEKINSVKRTEAAKTQKLGQKGEEIMKEFFNYTNLISGVLIHE